MSHRKVPVFYEMSDICLAQNDASVLASCAGKKVRHPTCGAYRVWKLTKLYRRLRNCGTCGSGEQAPVSVQSSFLGTHTPCLKIQLRRKYFRVLLAARTTGLSCVWPWVSPNNVALHGVRLNPVSSLCLC